MHPSPDRSMDSWIDIADGTPQALSLRSYLGRLVTAHPGSLRVLRRPVERVVEASSIVAQLENSGCPAILFANVHGSTIPLLTGLFGRRDRLNLALAESTLHGLSGIERFRRLAASSRPPHLVDRAPVREVVLKGDAIDLGECLPIPTHLAGMGGPYLTAGVLIARDPDTGGLNGGIYRMMQVGQRELTVNAAPGHDLALLMTRARERGELLEAAIVIGHHPSLLLASQAATPLSGDVLAVAGGLAGVPFGVVPGLVTGLPIPAEAEIVLEGHIDPELLRDEGPFAEFTHYPSSNRCPTFIVRAVTRRADAIFLDIHPTHIEHRTLGIFPGREAALLEQLREREPDIATVHLPEAGVGLTAIVQLGMAADRSVAGEAVRDVLRSDPMLKTVILVDDDVDVEDSYEVSWAITVRSQPHRDWAILENLPGTRNDPSTIRLPGPGDPVVTTSKVVIDATAPAGFAHRMDGSTTQTSKWNLSEFEVY